MANPRENAFNKTMSNNNVQALYFKVIALAKCSQLNTKVFFNVNLPIGYDAISDVSFDFTSYRNLKNHLQNLL